MALRKRPPPREPSIQTHSAPNVRRSTRAVSTGSTPHPSSKSLTGRTPHYAMLYYLAHSHPRLSHDAPDPELPTAAKPDRTSSRGAHSHTRVPVTSLRPLLVLRHWVAPLAAGIMSCGVMWYGGRELGSLGFGSVGLVRV